MSKNTSDAKGKANSSERKLEPYHGEALTPDEVAAIDAHLARCETSLGPDCYPLALSHGADPRLPYRRQVYKLRTATHQGQGKLCVALLRLLTEHGHRAKTVLYAGAAPGTNITLAAQLFPEHEFYLYDPAAFKLNTRGVKDARGEAVGPRIHAVRGFFTNDTAREWAAKERDLIFVSDIRKPTAKDADFEDEVRANMLSQLGWYEILGAFAAVSMFKFRLPYAGGGTSSTSPARSGSRPGPPSRRRRPASSSSAPMPPAPSTTRPPTRRSSTTTTPSDASGGTTPIPELEGGLLDVDGYDGCYDCRATVEAYGAYLLRHVDYYLPPEVEAGAAESKSEVGAGAAESKSEAGPAESAGPEPADPSRAALYPHVEILINRQMRHLRQYWRSPPHGMIPGGPMRDRRAGLFRFVASSRKKHQKRLAVHEKGRQRAKGGKPGESGAGASSGDE